MSLRPILRLLLAGLLIGMVLLTPWSSGEPDTPHLSVGYRAALADGPGDWPAEGLDLGQRPSWRKW